MSSRSESRRGPGVPLMVVPLLVYVGVTVVAPAVNGATRHDGFWEHAAITIMVSGLLTGIWLAAGRVMARLAARKRARELTGILPHAERNR